MSGTTATQDYHPSAEAPGSRKLIYWPRICPGAAERVSCCRTRGRISALSSAHPSVLKAADPERSRRVMSVERAAGRVYGSRAKTTWRRRGASAASGISGTSVAGPLDPCSGLCFLRTLRNRHRERLEIITSYGP